jgi:hypothetical protein
MTSHLMHIYFQIRNLPTTSSSNCLDSQLVENILLIRSFNKLFIDIKRSPYLLLLVFKWIIHFGKWPLKPKTHNKAILVVIKKQNATKAKVGHM